MYHKPIANVLWTLSRLVKVICTLQINWVSTTAQRGTLFNSGCKTAESKLDGKAAHAILLSLVPWMKLFEKLHKPHHWHLRLTWNSSCCSDFLVYQSLCQQWHDIWMATASQPKLLARMQTFLSNATVQRQLNGKGSMISGWQASTSVISWSTLMSEYNVFTHRVVGRAQWESVFAAKWCIATGCYCNAANCWLRLN